MDFETERLFSNRYSTVAPVLSMDTADLQGDIDTVFAEDGWYWCGLDLDQGDKRDMRVGWENESGFFTIIKMTAVVEEESAHIHVDDAVINEVLVIDPDGGEKRVYGHNLTVNGIRKVISAEFHRLNMSIINKRLTPTHKIHSVFRAKEGCEV